MVAAVEAVSSEPLVAATTTVGHHLGLYAMVSPMVQAAQIAMGAYGIGEQDGS